MDDVGRDVRLGVSSYVAWKRETDPKWPASGPATWEQVSAGVRPELPVVFALPVVQGASLHYQPGARWIVVELEDADPPAQDGTIAFRRGTVLFHGTAQEGRTYIASLGIAPPSCLTPLEIVADWASGSVGDHGTIVGGEVGAVSAGAFGLAYAKSGVVKAGDSAWAISDLGEVALVLRPATLAYMEALHELRERLLSFLDVLAQRETVPTPLEVARARQTGQPLRDGWKRKQRVFLIHGHNDGSSGREQ